MPTLQPCPTLIAATSQAARIACPALELSHCCAAPRRGHCIFRELLEHGEDTRTDGAAARARLLDFEDRGGMIRENRPHLLIYRYAKNGVRTTGVVGVCSATEFGVPGSEAAISIPERAADSTAREGAYLNDVGAHLEPVTVAIESSDEIDLLLRRDTNDRPRMHFIGPDRATHTIWSVPEASELLAAIAQRHSAMVVNHAQAAHAALRLAADHPGDDEASRVLVLLVPEPSVGRAGVELRIEGIDAHEFLELLRCETSAPPAPDLESADDPPKGSMTVLFDGTSVSAVIPEHDRGHDLLYVDELLRAAGVVVRFCPYALDSDHVDPTEVGQLRVRVHGLSLDDLRDAAQTPTQPRGRTQSPNRNQSQLGNDAHRPEERGLPPQSVWLPPVPLSGLVVHPFR